MSYTAAVDDTSGVEDRLERKRSAILQISRGILYACVVTGHRSRYIVCLRPSICDYLVVERAYTPAETSMLHYRASVARTDLIPTSLLESPRYHSRRSLRLHPLFCTNECKICDIRCLLVVGNGRAYTGNE